MAEHSTQLAAILGSLEKRNVAVVGMAKTGRAAARLLAARDAVVTVSDSAPHDGLVEAVTELRSLGCHVETDGHNAETFLSADLVVLSPGVPPAIEVLTLAREAGVPIIGELELAFQFCRSRIFAVTGTNGKTTCTTLIYNLLRDSGYSVALAGNNDTPFSSVVVSGENFDIVVLEVSSFQLESIVDFAAGVAVLLNIAPDHLDRYNSFEDYARAKLKIFERQSKTDVAILNKKDETTTLADLDTPAKRLWFSVDEEVAEGAFVRGDEIVFRTSRHDSILARTGDVALRGTHNLENVLAALCAACTLGGDSKTFSATLRGFAGLEHRMEHIATIGSVEFINDSKATNVDALARALESLSQPVVLIAGGRGKRSGYDALKPLVENRVRAMVLIGEDAPAIERTFSETTPVKTTATLPEAVETAWNLAKPGDVVLLSPACASFDMFLSFEERGEVFKHAVKEVEKNRA